MIRLNTTTRSLQAILAGAITTNQLPVTVGYSDGTSAVYTGAAQLTLTNSAVAVTICAAPASGAVRDIDYIAISNTDTAAATVTVRLNDSGTLYEQVKTTLQPGRQLVYTHASGWNVGPTDATPLPADPTASVGLTAVNGTAATYMRSDAAPPLDQSIAPTWSGNHRFNAKVSFAIAPSAWDLTAGTGGAAWDLGSTGGMFSVAGISGLGTEVVHNSYYDGTNWKYKTTSATARGRYLGSQYQVLTALSGTAGTNITWTSTLVANPTGIGFGTTPVFTMDLKGSAAVYSLESTTGTNAVYARFINTGGTFFLGTDDSTGSAFNTGLAYAGVIIRTGSNPIVTMINGVTQIVVDATKAQFRGKLYPSTPPGALQTAGAIYVCTGAPSNADGANGDFVFRTDGGVGTTLYIKTGGAWVGRA